jgi:hypothetical protein
MREELGKNFVSGAHSGQDGSWELKLARANYT